MADARDPSTLNMPVNVGAGNPDSMLRTALTEQWPSRACANPYWSRGRTTIYAKQTEYPDPNNMNGIGSKYRHDDGAFMAELETAASVEHLKPHLDFDDLAKLPHAQLLCGWG
ncbi:hypothetical protein E4U53_002185 [Claviceps sorghi]|nr:hypothetical protein E4U53_002185 [Claviceps sorghi]